MIEFIHCYCFTKHARCLASWTPRYLQLRGARVCLKHTGLVHTLLAAKVRDGHASSVFGAGFNRFGFRCRWRCRVVHRGLVGVLGLALRGGLSFGLRGFSLGFA